MRWDLESTFFFAPGANPWNVVISPWQHEFHKIMGSGNATLFNEKFRLYFTKESFDLFYPSYGDTWPLFSMVQWALLMNREAEAFQVLP